MTPRLTTEAFAALGGPDLVYVRPVMAREVLGSDPVELVKGFYVQPDQILYALHRADGERLGVMADRDAAMAAAVAHELAPVLTH